MKTVPRLLSFLSAASLLALVSCSTLQSEYYVGELSPWKDRGEETPTEKQSIWQSGETVFFVHAEPDETKPMLASTMIWNGETQQYEIKSSELIMGKLDDAVFLNVREAGDGLYTILRIAPTTEDGVFVFFTVNTETIKDLAAAAGIPLEESGNNYVLKPNGGKAELDKFVGEHMNDLFSYSGAGTIKWISGAKPK